MSLDGAVRLSVIVVTYNSSAALAAALPPLIVQLDPHDELVIVDNDSSDETLSVVLDLAPAATVIETGGNVGFAAAANAGAAVATGDLLVFLNPDATAAPDFADAIAAPLRDDRGWAAWMGLVTAESGSVVNTNGGVVHFTGIAWAGEAGRPAPGTLAGPRETAFLSGACLAIPRAHWDRAGGFAEAFFMYHEDVDLSLRLRLAGGRLGVEPTAIVDHDYEFAKGPDKWRALERNRWATIVRCYPGRLLFVLAPALLATELALLIVAAAGGWLPQKLRGTARGATPAAGTAARAPRDPGDPRHPCGRVRTLAHPRPRLAPPGRLARVRAASRGFARVLAVRARGAGPRSQP